MPVRHQRPSQSCLHAFLLALGLTAALPAAGAEIVLYERDSFRGRSFVSGQTISNFANVDFNDRAASVIIRSGSWQLCSDAYFRGRCVTLGPGEYPTLRSMALDNQVSSARELDWLGGSGASHPGGRVELFDGTRFDGRSFAVTGPRAHFPPEFNDRVRSMFVYDGYWEACEDIDYRGSCRTYSPGRHANLGGMANRVSSIRPATGSAPGPGGGPGSGGRVDLFDGIRFEGRAFAINGPVANFPNEFNDRVQSMIVHDGYWELCENIDYRGSCQTYGPGRHASLGGMTNRASSIRPAGDPGFGNGGWGSGARALLYEGPNLSGRTFVINAEVLPNLDSARFNDRASSLYPYNQNPTWPR